MTTLALLCGFYALLTGRVIVDACSVFPDLSCCSTTPSLSEKLASFGTFGDLFILDPRDFVNTFDHREQLRMGEAPSPKHVRILCFGDSLTSGYMSSDWDSRPYGDTMQTELAHLLSIQPANIPTKIDGLPGDQVRGAYMRRMKRDCEQAKDQPYDWIIIMGGTNDLGWGQPAEVIYTNLKAIWKVALGTGANVLALNIIECANSNERATKRRNELNALIAEHKEDHFSSFDLWSVIRYNGIDDKTRERLWDDGLHLTAAGYEVMGKAVAARLFELLG